MTKNLSMKNKNHGEGLHVLWEILRKGINYRWKSFKEVMSELLETTNDNRHARDWYSEREDYRDSAPMKCRCDNWSCNKKH